MPENRIYHSIKIDVQHCIGCVACMKACPTKAIRVRKRRAIINYDRCIDCGECLRVCPCNAVVSLTTSAADLSRFKYKVALPSPVLYSQFGQNTMPNTVLAALEETGFDRVYDEAVICEMTSLAIEEYLVNRKGAGPTISTTCPVVVRLIQRLFPDLCSLIVPIEPPREIAAKNLRAEISKKLDIPDNEIGIIHITSCPAKMVSINQPESMSKSYLNGAVSIRDIFNQIMMKIKKPSLHGIMDPQWSSSSIGINWAITGGETNCLKTSNTIAVSGVYDTIRILGDVESGRLKKINYLECMICPDGCVGGPLAVENRFIAKSNIIRLIRHLGNRRVVDAGYVRKLYKDGFFSFEHAVAPRPFTPLDNNRDMAIKKFKMKEQIMKKLPGINCGVCGAPDCETLAEDIAREAARLEECIFLAAT
ncbi:MAG TPA: [Fe-Fe] hydrogenase large subunit C-terminal domain-containing protein [bacterium]